MSERVKVGVVGVGGLGQWHAKVYAEMESAELVGVYDKDDARAAEIAGTYGVARFPGLEALGAAVEAAAGMHFVDCLRSNVFTPAHMDHTRLDDVYSVIAHRARGYRRTLDGGIENCALADDSNKIPGGGFVSTAGDLVRFAAALEGGQLANKQSCALMFTPTHTTGGRPVPYGLGWMILDRGGKRWVGHSGAQPGASAYLLVSPSDGFSLAVLANLEGVDLLALSVRIADITLP